MREVDVIMLALTLDREVWEMNTEAIRSLRASEPNIRFNVLVLESNRDWPAMGLSYDAETQVHIPDADFNFNRYNNIGREMTKADWVVFANNDVVFHPGWCSAMFSAVEKDPNLVCLCPMDPKSPHTPPGTFPEGIDYQVGYMVRSSFTGWCFMVRRDVFDKTGPFDERFEYYYADDDFVMTLRKHALLNAVVPSAHVNHLAHITSKKAGFDISGKFKKAQSVFHAKWGAQRMIAWKNRLVKYFFRPLGMKGIIHKLYSAK